MCWFFRISPERCATVWPRCLLRQFGHAVLEPPCHDKEARLLGFNTRNKTLIVLGYLLLCPSSSWCSPLPYHDAQKSPPSITSTVAQQWFLWTIAVVVGRIAYLVWLPITFVLR